MRTGWTGRPAIVGLLSMEASLVEVLPPASLRLRGSYTSEPADQTSRLPRPNLPEGRPSGSARRAA